MIGTWMQQMALSWLIYRLTGSVTLLGVIAFATQAPSLLITPLAGILTDRLAKKRLVIVTQACAMVQASLLAAVTLAGHVQIWQLMALGVFLGIVNAFDLPSRQTFLVEMLKSRDELPNAIATNSSIVTLTRIIGPAVAGFFIARVGEGMCFLANAVSYIAVIGALLLIRSYPSVKPVPIPVMEELKEGFSHAFGSLPIRSLIVMIGLVSFVAMPYATLMPALAKDVFRGDASTLGLLTGAAGFGSLIGALYLSSRKGVLGLGRWIVIGCLSFGLGLIALGAVRSLPLGLFCLCVAGFGSMLLMAACNTLIQTVVDEDKRGRVMSIYTMAFIGLAPFGSMVAGVMASHFGPSLTVLVSGCMCVLIAFGFAFRLKAIRQETRPIYLERGILSAETELKLVNS